MRQPDPNDPISLRPLSGERVEATPLASLDELLASLQEPGSLWGYLLTPTLASLRRCPTAQWRELLSTPRLLEARIFSPSQDLHWLDGRGVALTVVAEPRPGAELVVAGDGWWWRDRRCRLWGEHLEGRDAWYEERIPDPQRYDGLEAGAENRFAFLELREYVRGGRVELVRFLNVKS